MAKALVIAVAVAVLVAVAAASNVPSGGSGRAIYLGYNASYCRGLNFTLPVPGNCSGFYQCLANNVYLDYCKYPLLYNHVNGLCDQPRNVRCNRTSASGFAKAALPVVSDRAGAIYIGYNASYCRGLNFTVFVPGNCSAFYQCQNNNIWLNYCQKPLMYNHLNGFCDHAWNVRCNRNSAKSVAGSTEQNASSGRILYPPVNQCLHPWNCFVAPCSVAPSCNNIPEARCFDDYCEGCSARFFKINTWQTERSVYEEVTHQCHA